LLLKYNSEAEQNSASDGKLMFLLRIQKVRGPGLALVLSLNLLAGRGYASEEISELNPSIQSSRADAETFKKTQAVLNYYLVPDERDPGPDLSDIDGLQTLQGAQSLLKYLDPMNVFSRLSKISSSKLEVFQDLDQKKVDDFSLNLALPISAAPEQTRPLPLDLPLQGLKIALDPGHMGGQFWDRFTGKYVKDAQGNVISEAVINLQACLLLRDRLVGLGAEVMITHEGLQPVSTNDLEKFDIVPFAQDELRNSIHADWFLKLTSKYPIGSDLFSAFDKSPERKKLFSENSRGFYFTDRSELWARAEMINKFDPDLVLILHHDTSDSNGNNAVNPKSPNRTKAFIVGGFQPQDLGSGLRRRYFVHHLLDQKSWDQSLSLSRHILQQMHQQLKIDIAPEGTGDPLSYSVEPGIFARDLNIPRMLKAPAISYLECLFYDRPTEFNAFLKANHPMLIDGKNIPYSDRTLQEVQAIADGIIEFARQR
jgi:N-acetylmuramoyl-L-alanine amidase